MIYAIYLNGVANVLKLAGKQNVVKSVGFNYKEQGAKSITNRRATSDSFSEFKSFDYITNFLLFPNNLDLILNEIPSNSLDGIYILFPNPWIKNKQKKKRIFNKERLKILQDKLKDNGNLVFASDIENYFYEAIELIEQNGNFEIMNKDDYLKPHDNYIITKYHQKAIRENRTPKFMILRHVLGDH